MSIKFPFALAILKTRKKKNNSLGNYQPHKIRVFEIKIVMVVQ